LLDFASKTNGYFLEMGVGMGRTINFMAALNPTKTIYGFDWFEGLPEDWDKGDHIIQQGTFAL
jgi:tRNA G46 methylase TrmB